jgi:hypothetical protein
LPPCTNGGIRDRGACPPICGHGRELKRHPVCTRLPRCNALCLSSSDFCGSRDTPHGFRSCSSVNVSNDSREVVYQNTTCSDQLALVNEGKSGLPQIHLVLVVRKAHEHQVLRFGYANPIDDFALMMSRSSSLAGQTMLSRVHFHLRSSFTLPCCCLSRRRAGKRVGVLCKASNKRERRVSSTDKIGTQTRPAKNAAVSLQRCIRSVHVGWNIEKARLISWMHSVRGDLQGAMASLFCTR